MTIKRLATHCQLFLLCALLTATAQAEQAFITIWKTDNSGSSGYNQLTVPTSGGGYDYDIYWERLGEPATNGSATGVTGSLTLTLPDPGTYRVEITGSFPRIHFNNEGDRLKILSIEQWGDIQWSSMHNAFYGASNLVINATDAPDLSGVSVLNSMFREASSINTDLDWDVSTITNASAMFMEASAFNGDISGWDVSNLLHASSMFMGATAFNSDISNWNVSQLQNMANMFTNAASFNQDIGGWDTSSVNSLSQVFFGASAFNQDISGWSTGQITSMSMMFWNASSFNQDLGQLDISSVTNMSAILGNTAMSIENYDRTLLGWAAQDVQSGVTLGSHGLQYCRGLIARLALIEGHDWSIVNDQQAPGCRPFITTWKTDNPGTSEDNQLRLPLEGSGYDFAVYWGDGTFSEWTDGDDPLNLVHEYDQAGEYTIRISGDFPRIYFANGGERRKVLSIEQWGDIQWLTMDGAFWGALNLVVNASDAPDLSAVTSLFRMFTHAPSVNSDLNWDVSGVTNLSRMFAGATAFNGNISGWNVSKATDMSGMFDDAVNFNVPIGGWNVGQVSDFSDMFQGAESFNQDLSSWAVAGAEDMSYMFHGAASFNQDLSAWNVGNVTDMRSMFSGATAFNQDLGGWNVANVADMDRMLDHSGMSTTHYDATLIGWAALSPGLSDEVDLGAENLTFCASESARSLLIDTHSWWITGDTMSATCGQTFSIGGTVSGLEGSGLVLQNNASDDLVISGNGPFAFNTELPDEATYHVTIGSQPDDVLQRCTVTNGSGMVSGDPVNNISVNCVVLPDAMFQDRFQDSTPQ